MNIRELARHVDLGIGTVSRALSDSPLVAPATRRRVLHWAKKTGYRPDPSVAKVMSAISRRPGTGLTEPIVLLAQWPHRNEWKISLGRFFSGITARAGELGYRIEEFWTQAPGMSPARVEQILAARGTQGVIVFNYPSAPATLDVDLSPYACSVIGRALVRPRLFAVDHDHHQGMVLCLDEIKRRGYRRPALVLDPDNNERTMHCWAAAWQFYLSQLPARSRIPCWLTSENDAPRFRKWVRMHRPDAIIISNPWMLDYIQTAGFRVPADFGLAVLFQASGRKGFAGIYVGDTAIGARAVDLVVEQILRNRRGIPSVPETVLIDGTWQDGATMPGIPARTVPEPG